MGDLLRINPAGELKFRFELRKNIPVTLSLHNPGTERVAFKVKTTSPKKYCVRPSSGIVEPNTTKDVQVIMQAQREMPPNMSDCKDKFLVQAVPVGPDVKDVAVDAFDNTANTKQTKLRVVLVGPPKPPSPVPEGVEEEPSPIKNTFKDSTALPAAAASSAGSAEIDTVLRERNQLKEKLALVEKQKADVQRKLDMAYLQTEGRGIAAGGSGQKLALRGGGYSLLHLLLVAVIAFLLGHYTISSRSQAALPA